MLVFDGVWKTFGPSPALRGISLAVSQGDALLVTGPSGAGKTTMLRLLYGAETADRGEVYVAGRSLKRLSRSSLPYVRRNLGVLFQDFRLLPDRSACDNVALALEILGTSRAEARRAATRQLADVGLSAHVDTRTASLSGGEQQRVALARALVNSPTVLLADEPTGSLDPERAAEVLVLLDAAHKRGSTVIVATHDPQVIAFGRAHDWRHAHLENGQLVDLDMPAARPARTDDDTNGFSTKERADDTMRSRLAKEGRSAPADTPRPEGAEEGRLSA